MHSFSNLIASSNIYNEIEAFFPYGLAVFPLFLVLYFNSQSTRDLYPAAQDLFTLNKRIPSSILKNEEYCSFSGEASGTSISREYTSKNPYVRFSGEINNGRQMLE